MRKEAENYNYLCDAVRSKYCTKQTFDNYRNSWKRLLSLNEQAYIVMYEYRTLCNTLKYRFLFFVGILPKQHTFRFVNDSKTQFDYNQMINLLYLK